MAVPTASTPIGQPQSLWSGVAEIASAGTSVAVVYEQPFVSTQPPMVVITPSGTEATSGAAYVTHQGSAGAWTGFTINVPDAPGANNFYSYLVAGQDAQS